MSLRAGSGLILPAEKELTTALDCSGKERYKGIFKVELTETASLTNKKVSLLNM